MRFCLSLSVVGVATAYALPTTQLPPDLNLPIHNISRFNSARFENLAIRSNGQILSTTTAPNASIYQIDPLSILPPTIVYTIPNVTSANGIAERERDVFYVASGDISIQNPLNTTPSSYSIIELDMRGVEVLPTGNLTRAPKVRTVARLPQAALLNGIAFAAPLSDHLLVADSFRGLIWNVDICTGEVGVTLNDTATKGSAPTGEAFTGINGMKVHDGAIYWTSTGLSSFFSIPVDDQGHVPAGATPKLITQHLTCDDFAIDCAGNAYIAGPLDVLTKVSPDGKQQILTGTYNSSAGTLPGPTAVKFGRLASDRWSVYVTLDGGFNKVLPPNDTGIVRIDLEKGYECGY